MERDPECISNDSSYSTKKRKIKTTTTSEWKFNLHDLLCDMWDSTSSMIFNLKLIIGFVSKYVANQLESVAPTVFRIREGSEIKRVLTDLLFLWVEKGSLSTSVCCSTDDLCEFIDEHRCLKDTIERVAISLETYHDWLHDFKDYSRRNNNDEAKRAFVAAAAAAVVDDADVDVNDKVERKKKKKSEDIAGIGTEQQQQQQQQQREKIGGLDSLFDSSISSRKERENGSSVFQQYITKLENGRLLSLKTPGETGKELIRMYVYDVKDIAKVDKRNWWKYAKLRTQFFGSPLAPLSSSSSSSSDRNEIEEEEGGRKRSLLRQLLDDTADELKKLPGAIIETSRIDFFGNNN